MLIRIHMSLANSFDATIETLPRRESLVRQATPPESLTPLELRVYFLEVSAEGYFPFQNRITFPFTFPLPSA